tara:strand:- start:1449 stop:2018 length:570 start_codon:yes stop_codon:yes gene_type:complete
MNNMNNVLYYSNYCEYSKKIITEFSRSNLKDSTYFVCVDKRCNKGEQIHIILENGKDIPLPKVVKSVPSLIICSRGNMLLTGDQIYNYINHNKKQDKHIDEPQCFSQQFDSFSSDTFSFIDTDPNEMNAQGNAGMMQMHNFVSCDYMDNVTTPEENYVPDTIGGGGDNNLLNKLIQERDKQIPKPVKPI